MFLFRSSLTNGPLLLTLPQLADETATDRQQRQLKLCRVMAEHGMKLAEAVAAQACSAVTDNPKYFRSQAILFTRLTHAVRQAIALENRIANGQTIRRAAKKPGAPKHPNTTEPNPAPRAERLDANYDSLPDEQIPLILDLIGANLGITIARPTPTPPAPQPEPPAPTPTPIAPLTPSARPAPRHSAPHPNRASQPIPPNAKSSSSSPFDTS